MKAIGYVRVSTEEQAASGLGLESQRTHLQQEADRRGWELELIADEGYSGKSLKRPGITRALEVLADPRSDVDILLVAKLDRVSRSVSDFAGLLDRAKKEGWAIVTLDLGIDMTTPVGEMVAHVMAALAQWERRIISERTKAALAVRKASGARLGAPRLLDPDVRDRIVAMRMRPGGMTLQAIADVLNAEEIPTTRGGARWWPSTVAAALKSVELDEAAEAARCSSSHTDASAGTMG